MPFHAPRLQQADPDCSKLAVKLVQTGLGLSRCPRILYVTLVNVTQTGITLRENSKFMLLPRARDMAVLWLRRSISFAYSEGGAASQRHRRRGALGPLAGAAEHNSRIRRRVHLYGRECWGPRQVQRSQSRGYV